MITTTDIANIVFKAAKSFDIPVYQGGNIPKGEIEPQGRIVIHVKEQTAERTWRKCFVEVNIFVPDTRSGNADLINLNTMERLVASDLYGNGTYDGTPYRFFVSSTTILASEELRAHYVNAKVLFMALNTMEK